MRGKRDEAGGGRKFGAEERDRSQAGSGKHSDGPGRGKTLETSLETAPRPHREKNQLISPNCPECGGILTTPDHDHWQIPVTAEGVHAHVDEGIAGLIWTCLSIGIVTRGSCQQDPDTGLAHLAFATGDAEPFVGAATDEDLDDPATFEGLGWRMRGADTPTDWIWQPGGFGWGVTFAALFPASDIPELVRRLGRWL